MSHVVYLIFMFCASIIHSVNCVQCEDKQSAKLKGFDSTRRNLVRSSSVAYAINYFDISFITRATLSDVKDFDELRVLDLSNNRISRIQIDTFCDFKMLESLQLSHNFLMEIHRNHFDRLNELSTLDLSSNLIDRIDRNAFVELKSLLLLNLMDNCIIVVAFNLPSISLHKINLSRNFIKRMPEFKNVLIINTLNLSDNTIEVLDFKNLGVVIKCLIVERNEIRRIINYVNSISKWINSLNIADNQLSNTTQLLPFVNVAELNLSKNPLDYVANVDFVRHLRKLNKLNLTNTNLTSIEVLRTLDGKQFWELSIGQNPLKVDFNDLQHFFKVRHLQFQQNECKEFYHKIREHFNDLTHLTIYYDTPDCKCSHQMAKNYQLIHINFTTDWNFMCSRGQDVNAREIITYLTLIVVQFSLIKFNKFFY